MATQWSSFLLALLVVPTLSIAQESCDLATSLVGVSWNQISARFNHSRADFTNEFDFGPAFEFPAGEGVHAMFASGFLFSGLTPSGELKASCQLFGANTDFAPGPLSVGDVATWAASCAEYDRFWLISRLAVAQHLDYFDCLNDPACDLDLLFPDGYTIPDDFLTWPAHGDLTLGQPFLLAPFYDYDTDGIYDPMSGDCPLFSDMSEDCGHALQGDVSLYWIENDRRSFEDATSTGIEVHNTVYAYVMGDAANPPYDRTLFHQRTVFNRGTNTLADVRMGAFVDPDLGNPSDDYVGVHVDLNMAYVYNGDMMDETTFALGYADAPPAVGYQLIQGPQQDPDETDNDGNGIVDDERLPIGSFMAAAGLDLSTDLAAYSLMHSTWPDGTPLTYSDTEIPAQFMYPGSSDSEYVGTGGTEVGPWDENTLANQPGDRAFVLATESFTLSPLEHKDFTIAYICHAFENDNWSTVNALVDYAEILATDFEACGPTSVGVPSVSHAADLEIFPNPSTGRVKVQGAPVGSMLEVVNLTGQVVARQHVTDATQTLDLTTLPAGMYHVRVLELGTVRMATLIKQ